MQKVRKWACQALFDGKRCKNRALIGTEHRVGAGAFRVPVKLKLCLSCSRLMRKLAAPSMI